MLEGVFIAVLVLGIIAHRPAIAIIAGFQCINFLLSYVPSLVQKSNVRAIYVWNAATAQQSQV